MMGNFVKGRCPVCGWQVSPKVWRRRLADSRVVGLLFKSAGKIVGASPLSSPEQLDSYARGLFGAIVGRLLAAVGNWVRWRWIPLKDVLNVMPIHYLGGGMWVTDYEREGKRPVERAASEYTMADGGSKLLFQRKVKTVTGRGSKDYGW